MKRVFIAINLPGKIKQELEKIIKETKEAFPHNIGKWVSKENLHITLVFLGGIKDQDLLKIIQRTKAACLQVKPFQAKISKISYGPAESFPPRLIWAELEKSPEMEEIARELGANRFLSHITLCRIKTWQWKAIEPEERPEIEKEINLEFRVKSIDIMESKLKRTGPEYLILESITLD